MIDRIARNQLSKLIRHLVSGLITNDEFEDTIPTSDDLAIDGVINHGVWYLYSDLHEHKINLNSTTKKQVARWILFLKSDLKYKWPNIAISQRALSMISFGKFGISTKEAWNKTGDIDVWPFIKKEDLKYTKLDLKKR